jgi:hypothetical protein
MTYRTEKDENGNEALFITAIIHGNIVDLDWPHEDDDAETYSQKGLARLETLVNADTHSYPSKTAMLTMRLCRQGNVVISYVACDDDYQDEAMRLAEKAAIDMYDSVFPDVAKVAREFVEESVQQVKQWAADDTLSRLAIGAGQQIAADQFLSTLLDSAKRDLKEAGDVEQRIGWLVCGGMALVPIGAPPFEKYRYFRAIGEVARRVNAEAVVYVSDGYELSSTGERTGVETLLIMWINPDGTCVSKGVSYTRRKHPQLKSDIITFSDDIATAPGLEQILVPAWGSYQPN